MKKSYSIIAASLISILAACSDDVPAVKDPHNPIVNDLPVSQSEFLAKYCDGKTNETCQKVRNARSIDSAKGNPPRF